MSRAIVAGGAGFIGSQLVDALLDRGDEVVCIDQIRLSDAANIRHLEDERRFEYVCTDMNSGELTELAKGSDEFYHLAANSDIRSGGQDPHIDFDNTLCTTRSALEAVRPTPQEITAVTRATAKRIPPACPHSSMAAWA